MKVPETCAVCKDGVKLQDPQEWFCGRVRDDEGFYTFPVVQRGWRTLPRPPRWCPLRKEASHE